MTGISIREFARRDGCDDKLVRRAIAKGHLTLLPDGKMDPALVGSSWREGNRPAEVKQMPPPGTLDLDAAEAFLANLLRGIFSTQADAEKYKENANAGLRVLELLIKAKRVVETDDVAEIIGAQFARVRTRILAIPAECAPQVTRLKTPAEVQEFLLRVCTEALEELAGYDGANPPA